MYTWLMKMWCNEKQPSKAKNKFSNSENNQYYCVIHDTYINCKIFKLSGEKKSDACFHMHKLTKWSGLINFHRSKKKHDTVTPAKKVRMHVRKKSIMQPARAFSITETDPSFFAVLTSANVFCASGSRSYPCWQWCCAPAVWRGHRRGLWWGAPYCGFPLAWR